MAKGDVEIRGGSCSGMILLTIGASVGGGGGGGSGGGRQGLGDANYSFHWGE